MTLLAKELMQKKVRSQFLDPNFDIFTSLISPPALLTQPSRNGGFKAM